MRYFNIEILGVLELQSTHGDGTYGDWDLWKIVFSGTLLLGQNISE